MSAPIDGVFCHVYQQRVLLDIVDQHWRQETLEDDDLDIALDTTAEPREEDEEQHVHAFEGVAAGSVVEAWRDLQLGALLGDGAQLGPPLLSIDSTTSNLTAPGAAARPL